MPQRLVLATVGVALLLSALLLVRSQPLDVGSIEPALQPSPASTSPSPAASASALPATAPTTAPDIPAARPARLADLDASVAAAPTRLVADRIGLDTPVVEVGVQSDGQMEVPEDVDDAGWYRHGPTPGAPGNAVVAGHVDDRVQGLGAFHRLVELVPGDRIDVGMADGTTTAWQVTGRREVAKARVPLDELFRRDGAPRLVLVTCGGEFDGRARSYRSNIVVVARPV